MKLRNILKVTACAVLAIGIAFTVEAFAAPESVANSVASSSSTKTKKFVKTKNKCQKSNCSCSGYWGYKHDNGTYEGACSNTDGHGHTCGHGPEKHGLRKW